MTQFAVPLRVTPQRVSDAGARHKGYAMLASLMLTFAIVDGDGVDAMRPVTLRTSKMVIPAADESLAIHVATSDVDTGTTLYKLRTTDKLASVAIQEGRQRSATFASLVEIVERSDTFVYVVSVHKLPHDMVGCLVHEGQGSGVRYLKVLVLMGMRSERMIVVLAHELQHVREVLDAGISNSQSAMGELFSRIGVPQLGTVTGEQFETKSAHEVMALVARELRTHRRVRQP